MSLVRPVHPRACGERCDPMRQAHGQRGSSPRLRGTRVKKSLGFMRTPVHPRACGERTSVSSPAWPVFGSSPRLRGTLLELLARAGQFRFIPAPAGNAWHSAGQAERHAVHPRACGEREDRNELWTLEGGSSPRLRGTLFRRSTTAARRPVHPRACGERTPMIEVPAGYDGSSPRLRGTHERSQARLILYRFIPAPAGNAPNVTDCPTRRKLATKNLPSSFVKDQGVAAAGKRPI